MTLKSCGFGVIFFLCVGSVWSIWGICAVSGAFGVSGTFAVCGHLFVGFILGNLFCGSSLLRKSFLCGHLRFLVYGFRLAACAVFAVCFVMCPMLVMFCLLGVYCLRTVYYQFAACPVFHPISIALFWRCLIINELLK